MKRIFVFMAIFMFVIMIAGCATMPKIDRDLTITKMVYCSEEPEGFGKYVEKKDNVVAPSVSFWIYIEYTGLMEIEDFVNLSGSLNIRSIKGVSLYESKMFQKTFKFGEYIEGYNRALIGVLDKKGWISIKMISGYLPGEYEWVITLTDGYSGKQATESIWFKVNNTVKV